MNRIVREHYPASELPERLRGSIDPSSTVTVTIEEETQNVISAENLRAMVTDYRANRSGKGVSTAEAVRRIRELRDEWDD